MESLLHFLRRLLFFACFATTGGTQLALAAPAVVLKDSRPNIIFVLSDDTGWGEIGAAGNRIIQTPNIDKLHNEGVRLMNFHVATLCAPTRAQLMSGQHNFRAGVLNTMPQHEAYHMHADIRTVGDVLKEAGYATGLFGKWHLGNGEGYEPHERGFDTAIRMTPRDTQRFNPQMHRNGVAEPEKTPGFRTDILFDEAMQWIGQIKDNDEPFFCYLPTFNAHTKLEVEKKYSDPYEGKDLYEWTNPKNKKDVRRGAVYYGMHANLDHNIGRMLAFVKQQGLSENTLIIYASDNGHGMGGATKVGHGTNGFLSEDGLYNAGMRGGKSQIWRGGTCTPCFFYWPGMLNGDTEVHRVTGGIDLLPTLADFAGGKVDGTVDGKSILPLLENPAAEVEDRFLVMQLVHVLDIENREKQKYAIQSDRYRLIIGSKYDKGPALYDHHTDPGERKNIYAEHPILVGKMKQYYQTWWADVRPRMVNEPLRKRLGREGSTIR